MREFTEIYGFNENHKTFEILTVTDELKTILSLKPPYERFDNRQCYQKKTAGAQSWLVTVILRSKIEFYLHGIQSI